MAWKRGQVRDRVPLPLDATNEDLEWHLIYDTGKRKIGDLYDFLVDETYPAVEQGQFRALMPGGENELASMMAMGHDCWTRASDHAIVFQTWVMMDEAKRHVNEARLKEYA